MNTIPQPDLVHTPAIEEYLIIEEKPTPEFEAIIQIATMLFDVPIAMISLIDANQHKIIAKTGISTGDTAREFTFNTAVIESSEKLLFITDASKQPDINHHTYISGENRLLFYAGAAIINHEGIAIGAISVMDYQPLDATPKQINALKSLAKQCAILHDYNIVAVKLAKAKSELESVTKDLEKFAYIASHDLKSPINNLISLSHLLQDNYEEAMDEEGVEYLQYVNVSAYKLLGLVNNILDYVKSSLLNIDKKEQVKVGALLEDAIYSYNPLSTLK
ncbi:MAG: hypothetical protein EBX41_08255 [Chitinophagia bacterium]|nr:hypothetical protein [Chitinophagia bacterium]